MSEQIDQALIIVRACSGQDATLIVSGRGRGSHSCTGILHVGDGRISVSRDRGGWRHSLGVNTAALQSLEATVGRGRLTVRACISTVL